MQQNSTGLFACISGLLQLTLSLFEYEMIRSGDTRISSVPLYIRFIDRYLLVKVHV